MTPASVTRLLNAAGTSRQAVAGYSVDGVAGEGTSCEVSAAAGVDRFVGKREVNGVYIGKDHFLFEKPSVWDDERMTRTLNTINLVTAKSGDIRSYMALAPNATELLKNYLPTGAPVTNQTRQIAAVYKNLHHVQCVDLVTPLKAVSDPTLLYYRTDHHWTATAAEVAFREIATAMGLVPDAVSYKTMPVTNSFQGTMASTSGIFKASDTISITVPGSFETTGPQDVTITHRLESSPFTNSDALRMEIFVTSHSGPGWVIDFAPLPCPTE